MTATDHNRLKSAYRDAARHIHPDFAEHEADRKWRNAEMAKLNAAFEARDVHEVEKILHLAKARIPDQDEILSFQSRLLRRSIENSEFELYRAALEWSLVEPIVIDGRADLKSEQTWKDRVEPFHHQVTNLVTFCRRLPVTLLADDVGLGKTISAGLIASELMSRGRLSKILVVGPKLLGPQWKEELESKFNIPSVVARGQELIDADVDGEFGAVITTYHAAREHIDKLPSDRFQMLILDEAHKLRNLYGTSKPPQVALRFREVLAAQMFPYVLMLTATPIQNRLWDIYSLIDLLAVARGHDNPFGKQGMFARKFIADNTTTARQLRLEGQQAFRDIVYRYMSRVRRNDAQLHFPDRIVLLSGVQPTSDEIEIIKLLVVPLQDMNALAQISILQALTSSPDALAAQLRNMVRRGTFPGDVNDAIQSVVKQMDGCAKLRGLETLVSELSKNDPTKWRMVIFTQRRETQTTIEAFLESRGIAVGTINGDSGDRNQETIAKFKEDPPAIHAIVSTEAGSEGVNLQAANVLVNFDLPWNPMIVEQRIGRVQRLASEHAKVFVYSVILSGTFEEYIVARLMEKLQMASHAIGDIEALLDASGMQSGDSGADSFEEEIRKLVMASLVGKDFEAATQQAVESIEKAKQTLADEERNIESLLGGMDEADTLGPKTPDLPPDAKSMEISKFVPAALHSLGAEVQKTGEKKFTVVTNGRTEEIIVSEESPKQQTQSTLYMPGSSALRRLANQMTQVGLQRVLDGDENLLEHANQICLEWVESFGGTVESSKVVRGSRHYSGSALLLMRATVAHDSYERLVDVRCSGEQHKSMMTADALGPVGRNIEDVSEIGMEEKALSTKATLDEGISEFCRFYKERRKSELQAVLDDERKIKKLSEDFTPRLQATLVGLDGVVTRTVEATVKYRFEGRSHKSSLILFPSEGKITQQPNSKKCDVTGSVAPEDLFGTCCQSGKTVMAYLLSASDVSSRLALPGSIVECTYSGKRVLADEIENSTVTGQPVAKTYLKTSSVSGARAEPNYFGECGCTKTVALMSELVKSEVSGKLFRFDQAARSVVSGKAGHESEFIKCELTKKFLTSVEAERCDETGALVLPQQLVRCEISDKNVLPTLVQLSDASSRRALKQFVLTSSISRINLLADEVVKSTSGNACSVDEAIVCNWSGQTYHPDDIRVCNTTGLSFHSIFVVEGGGMQHEQLLAHLDGSVANADRTDLWPIVEEIIVAKVGGKVTIESSQLSPSANWLVFSSEVKKYLGFQVQHVGGVFSVLDNQIVGRLAVGRRKEHSWSKT